MIIEYDFGKKERAAAKRFAKPAISAAPDGVKRFGNALINLEFANARLAKLEAALRNAYNAAAGEPNEVGGEQILVDAAEYGRLLRCKELVAAALRDM